MNAVPEAVHALMSKQSIGLLAQSVCAMGKVGHDIESAMANVKVVMGELVRRLLGSGDFRLQSGQDFLICHRDLAQAFLHSAREHDAVMALAMTRCLQHLAAAHRLETSGDGRRAGLTGMARQWLQQVRLLHDAVDIIEQSCIDIAEGRVSQSP